MCLLILSKHIDPVDFSVLIHARGILLLEVFKIPGLNESRRNPA